MIRTVGDFLFFVIVFVSTGILSFYIESKTDAGSYEVIFLIAYFLGGYQRAKWIRYRAVDILVSKIEAVRKRAGL